MPASLSDLEQDLARALGAGDFNRAGSVRETIADAHGTTEAGAEANYKLGLAVLFGTGDLERAAERFRLAIQVKGSRWSGPARTSLGLVLHRLGKPQQALFELRKVAAAKPPSVASATALGLVALVLKDMNQPAEFERARKEQLKLLEGLLKAADAEEAALASYMLGMEYKYEGRRAEAKKYLERALASEALGPEEKARIEDALKMV
jgi:tetratricopeptide (TPR) repeat protein